MDVIHYHGFPHHCHRCYRWPLDDRYLLMLFDARIDMPWSASLSMAGSSLHYSSLHHRRRRKRRPTSKKIIYFTRPQFGTMFSPERCYFPFDDFHLPRLSSMFLGAILMQWEISSFSYTIIAHSAWILISMKLLNIDQQCYFGFPRSPAIVLYGVQMLMGKNVWIGTFLWLYSIIYNTRRCHLRSDIRTRTANVILYYYIIDYAHWFFNILLFSIRYRKSRRHQHHFSSATIGSHLEFSVWSSYFLIRSASASLGRRHSRLMLPAVILPAATLSDR